MSLSLCYFQNKNIKLAQNEIEIPFKIKLFKFNFKAIKSISNRLSADAKKRIKIVQTQVDKQIVSSYKKLSWMRGLQKINIIFLLGFIIGIYYMTLDGIDKENETFQAGVYILAATGLLIILVQIICIFIWHHVINYIYHEVSLLLHNEIQRYGNIIQWKLARNCSYIIFSYNSHALLSQSQMIESSHRSYLNNQSEEIITKKGGYISRNPKQPYEKAKQENIIQHNQQDEEDEEKEKVKKNILQSRNEIEMITVGNNNQDNEEEMLNEDSSENYNKIDQNQSKQKKPSKFNDLNQETPNQISHTKGISSASNKQNKENDRQPSNQYQKQQQGMLNFFSEEADVDEEIGSEQTDQNNQMLQDEQYKRANLKTKSKQEVPLVLEYQNQVNSVNQTNQFQTDHSLFSKSLKDQSLWVNSNNPSPLIINQNHYDSNENDHIVQTKKSKFKQSAHGGDDTPIEDEEDDEEMQNNNKKQSKSKQQSKYASEFNHQLIDLDTPKTNQLHNQNETNQSHLKQEEQTDQDLQSQQKHEDQLIDLRDD